MTVAALVDRPKLKDEHIWLYEAYRTLSRSRQVGGAGEFYIPCSEYKAYMDIINLQDVGQRTFMMDVVAAVDATLLHERYEKPSNG